MRSYARGREAFKTSAKSKPTTTEHLHEWRKRVKDLFYQEQLLVESWPGRDEGTSQGGQEALEAATARIMISPCWPFLTNGPGRRRSCSR